MNLSSASPRDIVDLERSATAIFQHAGLKAIWQNCLNGQPEGCTPARSNEHSQTLVWLRIVDRLDRGSVHTLGWTIMRSFTVTIQSKRAQQMSAASTIGISTGQILGHVTAHEIGHVLLEPHGHELFGVMKSSYNREDLLKMAQGRLLFTAEDARIIHDRLKEPPNKAQTKSSQAQTLAIHLYNGAHAPTGSFLPAADDASYLFRWLESRLACSARLANSPEDCGTDMTSEAF